MGHVFISYSSKDRAVADAVRATLEAGGMRCWIAPRDIQAGADWGEAIIDAISASQAMVLIFSANANASPQIKREVERAVNREVPVVPFRIEDVAPSKSLEYFICTPHWLDAYAGAMDKHLARLLLTLRPMLEGNAAPAGPERGWAGNKPVWAPRVAGARFLGKAAGTVVLLLVAGAIWSRLLGFGMPHSAVAVSFDGPAPAVVMAPSVPTAEMRPTRFDGSPGGEMREDAFGAPPPLAPVAPPPPPRRDEQDPPPRPALQPPPPPPGLRVQSVVARGQRKVCMINGRVRTEGELVDGFTIVQIHDHGVVVARGPFQFDLPIGK